MFFWKHIRNFRFKSFSFWCLQNDLWLIQKGLANVYGRNQEGSITCYGCTCTTYLLISVTGPVTCQAQETWFMLAFSPSYLAWLWEKQEIPKFDYLQLWDLVTYRGPHRRRKFRSRHRVQCMPCPRPPSKGMTLGKSFNFFTLVFLICNMRIIISHYPSSLGFCGDQMRGKNKSFGKPKEITYVRVLKIFLPKIRCNFSFI